MTVNISQSSETNVFLMDISYMKMHDHIGD